MRLTVKQQKFIDAYIESGNATKAALDAGYSPHTARTVGSQNLSKLDIKKAIEEKLTELESHKIASQKEVLEYLTTVMRGEAKETIVVSTPDGAEAIENDPSIKDRMAAGRDLLKRYPDTDKLLKAQLRKTKAEAKLLEAQVKSTTGNSSEGVVIVDDIPDES